MGESTTEGEELRLGKSESTAPYMGGHPERGSGTTAGPGAGNKTGGFAPDSRSGQLMEKVGKMTNKEEMVEKGHQKRVDAGYEG